MKRSNRRFSSVLPAGEHSERVIAIVGVADEAKGEALVLLSSIELDLPGIRAALSEIGVPNLWIPKTCGAWMPFRFSPQANSISPDARALAMEAR